MEQIDVMIFGIMRVINFAQGDFMMVGMYAAYFVFTALGFQALFGSGLGPYLSVIAAAPAMFAKTESTSLRASALVTPCSAASASARSLLFIGYPSQK